jgi:putative ABC transport system permease protein
VQETITTVQNLYKKLFPDSPFEYFFADQEFDNLYRNDRRFARLFGLFAGLAILIACLGLFGLASFTAQQRTKEIGVRKVLGASVQNVVILLAKDFLLLVLVGFIIAAPVAYFSMQRWLENFAYRIEVSAWILVVSGLCSLLIALLTVSYQSIRAATADPVKSLRYQ